MPHGLREIQGEMLEILGSKKLHRVKRSNILWSSSSCSSTKCEISTKSNNQSEIETPRLNYE